MDKLDLERERGITILSKNTALSGGDRYQRGRYPWSLRLAVRLSGSGHGGLRFVSR